PADHFVELRKNALHALGILDHFDHHGQVLRKPENLVGVIAAGGAVAAHAAQYSGAAQSLFAEIFHQSFVERLAMPFIGFANVDAHQRGLAFESLMFHRVLLSRAHRASPTCIPRIMAMSPPSTLAPT